MNKRRAKALPLFSGESMTSAEYRSMIESTRPEAEIQASIRRELQRRGWWTIRFNSGGLHDGKRYIPFYDVHGIGSKGLPDLMAIRGNGTEAAELLLIEVKTKSGRLTDSQRRFRAFAEAQGIIVHVARSWEDVAAILGSLDPIQTLPPEAAP